MARTKNPEERLLPSSEEEAEEESPSSEEEAEEEAQGSEGENDSESENNNEEIEHSSSDEDEEEQQEDGSVSEQGQESIRKGSDTSGEEEEQEAEGEAQGYLGENDSESGNNKDLKHSSSDEDKEEEEEQHEDGSVSKEGQESSRKGSDTSEEEEEEEEEEESKKKKRRKVVLNEVDDAAAPIIPEKKADGDFVKRLWSSEDEVLILRGMIQSIKKAAGLNMDEFYNSVKDTFRANVSKHQFKDKVHKLKRSAQGVHEEKKKKKIVLDHLVERKDTDLKEFWSLFPRLKASLESPETFGFLPESAKDFMLERISTLGKEEASKLEKRWKDFHVMELEIHAKRMDLIIEQTKAMHHAIKTSKS